MAAAEHGQFNVITFRYSTKSSNYCSSFPTPDPDELPLPPRSFKLKAIDHLARIARANSNSDNGGAR
eukprot:scaffold324332_cov28-Attheya_sp.AAC.1